jgi:tRNA A-37 threonylcarbamoyl transferase component Bud32
LIKYQLNKNYENIKDFLLNIKYYFQNNFNTIHKARNELKVIEYRKLKMVVKSFKIPNFINQIVYAYFRDSKAKKSYKNAIKLINLGINTPKPVGYIEFYKNFLFKDSFFISEKLDYLFTIREPLRDLNFVDRELILKRFVVFTYNLHKKGIYHKDYSAGNILVFKNERGEYDFSLVDINRMEFKYINLELALDNFAKLWLDEVNLYFIAKEYAKLSDIDEQKAINILKNRDKKLKNFIKLKRKIKGQIS